MNRRYSLRGIPAEKITDADFYEGDGESLVLGENLFIEICLVVPFFI